MATYSIISSVIIYFFICVTVCNSQTLKPEETKLYDMIMEYRASYGLPKIPLSKSLTIVARTHIKDLILNKPDTGNCNMHSWSADGEWEPVCYTPDHKNAEYARLKAKEIVDYPGYAYEIIARVPIDFNITAKLALDGFKSSPPHNAAIVNLNNWNDNEWKAIGVAVYANYACVWFGEY